MNLNSVDPSLNKYEYANGLVVTTKWIGNLSLWRLSRNGSITCQLTHADTPISLSLEVSHCINGWCRSSRRVSAGWETSSVHEWLRAFMCMSEHIRISWKILDITQLSVFLTWLADERYVQRRSGLKVNRSHFYHGNFASLSGVRCTLR